MLNGLCVKKWFRIVQIRVDVVAADVDAADSGIYLKERKAEAIALQSVGVVSAFEASISQWEKRWRSETISIEGSSGLDRHSSKSWAFGFLFHRNIRDFQN
jgi:hypothetical protein